VYFSHPTSIIEDDVSIGEKTSIWHFCHVRKGAKIGRFVSLARDNYIDSDVQIGDHSRVQNGVSIYKGVSIGRWCFVGPHVIFTNDQFPRVGVKSWKITPTILHDGCSIGAGAIIRCGVSVGSFAMVGAGAIVTKSIPPFSLVVGTPGKVIGQVCACGQTQMPLDNQEHILECCEQNLEPELLDLAKVFIDEYLENFSLKLSHTNV
jgi:UDP-2-acetamido-3-amino-2,3-dideoxy-glucuronate N-acetyltransferase